MRVKQNNNDGKAKKRKKVVSRPAIEQCRIRDQKLQEKFAEQGKDFEKYKTNLAEYINAKVFSRPLCSAGSTWENLGPCLRSYHTQALNRLFYAQEKYEKKVKAERKKKQLEADRQLKKAAQKRKREQREQERAAKRARTSSQQQQPNENAVNTQLENMQQPIETNEVFADDLDYFGAEPDDDNDVPAENSFDGDYDPAALMEREINALCEDSIYEEDDELGQEVDIFDTPDVPSVDSQSRYVMGDSMNRNKTSNEVETTLDLGTFDTNNPAFFDLNRLTDMFKRVDFNQVTDDNIFMESIRSYWSQINNRICTVSRKKLQKWSERILERLDEENRHKEFQIHDYGDAVLKIFGDDGVGKEIKFGDIVRGVPKYEVSRYLLATLILANCGNIEIFNSGEQKQLDGDGQPTLNEQTTVKLLSLQRHHDVFQSEQQLVTG